MKVIEMADIRVGMKIVGRVKVDEAGEDEIVTMRRPTKVEDVEPCPGARRTHVHVNRQGCWDGRTRVEVA